MSKLAIFYACYVVASAGSADERLTAAFSSVARADYVVIALCALAMALASAADRLRCAPRSRMA